MSKRRASLALVAGTEVTAPPDVKGDFWEFLDKVTAEAFLFGARPDVIRLSSFADGHPPATFSVDVALLELGPRVAVQLCGGLFQSSC